MGVNISEDGSFELVIESKQLATGLRPSKRIPRNSGVLVESKGAVGFDGVLQALESLTRVATTAITDLWPYPQIFVFTNLVLVCSQTKIYELDPATSALTLKLTTSAGSPWVAVDYFDYIYLTNGVVSVTRDAGSKVYATSSLPFAAAACNYNGQLLIGAPDESVLTSGLMGLTAHGVPTLTVTVLGTPLLGVVKSGTIEVNVTMEGVKA